MIIKNFWKSLLIMTVILVLSMLPDKSHHEKTPVLLTIALDKWEHLLAYMVLTLSQIVEFLQQDKSARLTKNAIWISCLLSMILGSLIELLQKLIPSINRSPNPKDILANAIGIILALLVYLIIRRKNLPFIGRLKPG